LHQIREGTVADAPASIRELAAHAGGSVGTVSKVPNRPDIVAEPTRSRLRDAIKQLGFIRNESARQPRRLLGRTAAQLLLEEALGEEAHQHRQVAFEPELVVRRSSQARANQARASQARVRGRS
jgi:DNA-binding LacI/PurR family transcriptional regulator